MKIKVTKFSTLSFCIEEISSHLLTIYFILELEHELTLTLLSLPFYKHTCQPMAEYYTGFT